MGLFGNAGQSFGKLPGLKLPSLASGASTLNPSAALLSPYANPTYSVPSHQYGIPGATGSGSQIDTPGGPNGYASGPNQADVQKQIAAQLGAGATQGQIDDWTKQYNTYLSGDQTLLGQKTALNDALHSYWNQNVTTPAQQAEVAYGGSLPAGQHYAAPTDLAGNSFGQSLVDSLNSNEDYLNGQTVGQVASSNPFSDLAQIQQQNTQADSAAVANAVAHGLGFSGEIAGPNGEHMGQFQRDNLAAADLARNTAGNNFQKTISDLYQNYLGQMGSAADKQTGYQTDAFNRVMALINAGILAGKPTTPAGNPPGTPPGLPPGALPAQITGPTLPTSTGEYPHGGTTQTPQGYTDYGIFGPSDLTGNETPTQLQSGVSTPDYSGLYPVYPMTNALPTAIRAVANKTGASANKTQGIFSIH